MKKIVYLTGTRADFGKLKTLIEITSASSLFKVYIFVTGMHMNSRYGKTIEEISNSGFENIFPFFNHNDYDSMDSILARTVEGFSFFVKDIKPDLIIIHGDRPEALAGAIVGSFNNILTAHIEGGEISGTIDESIRHSASKLCHIHFVANNEAKKRLEQLGENPVNIFVIGSPDIDVMMSPKLPNLVDVKNYYDIQFSDYAILLFHPITTEIDLMFDIVKNLIEACLKSEKKYIVIYPNNDLGSEFIFQEYKFLESNSNFKIFPSLRFEYFLVLLKNSNFIIGNSSAGVREAPYYGVPTVNIGTRQQGRVTNDNIINCGYKSQDIYNSIKKADNSKLTPMYEFGLGSSCDIFLDILKSPVIWEVSKQKFFFDNDF